MSRARLGRPGPRELMVSLEPQGLLVLLERQDPKEFRESQALLVLLALRELRASPALRVRLDRLEPRVQLDLRVLLELPDLPDRLEPRVRRELKA